MNMFSLVFFCFFNVSKNIDHIRGIAITHASRSQHQLSKHTEQYGGQPYQPHYVEVLTSTGEFGTVSGFFIFFILLGLSRFRVVSSGFKWFQVVSSGFKWFQVVPIDTTYRLTLGIIFLGHTCNFDFLECLELLFLFLMPKADTMATDPEYETIDVPRSTAAPGYLWAVPPVLQHAVLVHLPRSR